MHVFATTHPVTAYSLGENAHLLIGWKRCEILPDAFRSLSQTLNQT